MTETMYRRSTTLLEAAIEDDMVALDRERGECFGFNATAAVVWKVLEQPRTHAEIVEALTEQFDVAEADCRADLDALIDQMIDMKLIAADG